MKKYITLFLLISPFLLWSCFEGALEEKMYSDVDSSIFDDSEKSANTLVDGAISTINQGQFFQYGSYLQISEFDSDHMIAGDWALKAYGAGNFTLEPGPIDAWWEGRYALIYRCNYAIEKIEKMTSLDPEMKNNMLGQLMFLKGWSYFQLVQAYGPVPVHRQKVFTPEEYHIPREPVTAVYDHIIELLNSASDLLFMRSHPKYEKGRISRYAAKTLLAKVYCAMASGSLPAGTPVTVIGGPTSRDVNGVKQYIEQPMPITHQKEKVEGYDFDPAYCYTRVKGLCDSIIASDEFQLYQNYKDTWKLESRNGPEFIWQLQASTSIGYLRNALSADISGYLPENNNGLLSGALYGMRDHWYKLFEEQDLRAREGVRHLYAFYLVDWDIPEKGQPWYFYYPNTDSLRITIEHPEVKVMTLRYDLVVLTKYEAVSDAKVSTSDYHYPFLRYPIVYLMLAEAENELGNTQRAKEAVDVIRRRAQASLISDKAMTQLEIRSFILEERARELAMEGIRKWDLLRWGIYLQVMNAVDSEGAVIKRRQRRNLLFPIPLSELNANKMIDINNPGW
jgi:hypothetical protein